MLCIDVLTIFSRLASVRRLLRGEGRGSYRQCERSPPVGNFDDPRELESIVDDP